MGDFCSATFKIQLNDDNSDLFEIVKKAIGANEKIIENPITTDPYFRHGYSFEIVKDYGTFTFRVHDRSSSFGISARDRLFFDDAIEQRVVADFIELSKLIFSVSNARWGAIAHSANFASGYGNPEFKIHPINFFPKSALTQFDLNEIKKLGIFKLETFDKGIMIQLCQNPMRLEFKKSLEKNLEKIIFKKVES